MRYDFLVETYETERVKVVSTWSEFRDEDMHICTVGLAKQILAVEACWNRWCISA